MDVHELQESLHHTAPPSGSGIYIQALWYDAKGDWNKAHELIQDLETKEASWIHAYLHRKEGDVSNAAYWYHRASKKIPTNSLSDEWRELVLAIT